MNGNPFFELLQISVGTRESFSRVPESLQEWQNLLSVVADHGVLGVTFPVIKALFFQGAVPSDAFIPWGLAAEEIGRKNKRQLEAGAEIYGKFREDGFRNCLLKGQAAGANYPDPLLRQSGDIDLWVEGSRDDILAYLRNRYSARHVVYHHCDAKIFRDVSVEVHFMPTWMNNPFVNRRLQKWFAALSGTQFSHYDTTLCCCIPTRPFDGVFFLIHILRHLLSEGIGLRQLMDYYYVLQHLAPEERIVVLQDLKHLGLDSFTGAVMYVLQEVFRLGEEQMLCPPDVRRGALLLEAILESGNFGMADPRFAGKAKKEGIVAHGWRKFKRNLRFLQLCPSEVIWLPFFVIWQYFWRKRQGYLDSKQ